eukprot:6981482-Pyramimonas_sp.AAC.1
MVASKLRALALSRADPSAAEPLLRRDDILPLPSRLPIIVALGLDFRARSLPATLEPVCPELHPRHVGYLDAKNATIVLHDLFPARLDLLDEVFL